MKEVPAPEADVKFLELLDEVEQGTTIAITREGKIVAYIAPINTPELKWPAKSYRVSASYKNTRSQ